MYEPVLVRTRISTPHGAGLPDANDASMELFAPAKWRRGASESKGGGP
jgi:hypothetical protein